jgi:hypothetical protein
VAKKPCKPKPKEPMFLSPLGLKALAACIREDLGLLPDRANPFTRWHEGANPAQVITSVHIK